MDMRRRGWACGWRRTRPDQVDTLERSPPGKPTQPPMESRSVNHEGSVGGLVLQRRPKGVVGTTDAYSGRATEVTRRSSGGGSSLGYAMATTQRWGTAVDNN